MGNGKSDEGRGKVTGLRSTSAHGRMPSPEVAGLVGGVARRVPDRAGKPSDSMLAVYRDRLTYTFIFHDDVASIHFDQQRREIFFRGHNIRFMPASDGLVQALWDLAEVLARDREGRNLLAAYRETLASRLADNT